MVSLYLLASSSDGNAGVKNAFDLFMDFVKIIYPFLCIVHEFLFVQIKIVGRRNFIVRTVGPGTCPIARRQCVVVYWIACGRLERPVFGLSILNEAKFEIMSEESYQHRCQQAVQLLRSCVRSVLVPFGTSMETAKAVLCMHFLGLPRW